MPVVGSGHAVLFHAAPGCCKIETCYSICLLTASHIASGVIMEKAQSENSMSKTVLV